MRRATAIAALLLALIAPAFAQGGVSNSVSAVAARLEAWDIEGAEELARQLERAQPDDPGTKFMLGRIAFEQGRYEQAVKLLGEALGPAATRNPDYQLAQAAYDQAQGTVVEESAHFSVRYRPGKDAALVPYTLETMERAFEALTADLGFVPEGKTRIEFYPSPKTLAKVSSLTEEAIRTTGTIALCKYNRLMVTSPRALWTGYEWLDTLVHEFVHLLVSKASGNTVPIWLHEGLAKYLETRWRGPAGQALDPAMEAMLVQAAKKKKLISFERMHPSIALLPSQEEAALAFAEVNSAIEYIDKRAGKKGLRTLIEAMRDGASDRDAVAKALGVPFDRFEADWRRSLETRPMPKVAPALEKLVFKDEKAVVDQKEREKAWDRGELGTIPDNDARRHAHLGELFRARDKLAAAAVEYEKAIARAGPTHPALARKYALTKLALGRHEEAEKVVRASLAAFPDEEVNHLVLGRILVASGRAAQAREHLLVANRQDPFDPAIHEALVQVGEATGDEALVKQERDVLRILRGEKVTWRAPAPGQADVKGWLRIESPPGRQVFVDGEDTGLTTPVAELELSAGEHVVRLVQDGEPVVERAVVIVADELLSFPEP